MLPWYAEFFFTFFLYVVLVKYYSEKFLNFLGVWVEFVVSLVWFTSFVLIKSHLSCVMLRYDNSLRVAAN